MPYCRLPHQDSDNLRDVCMTSTPVIDYWTAQAKAVIRFINEFNDFHGEKKVGRLSGTSGSAAPRFDPCQSRLKGQSQGVHFGKTAPSCVRQLRLIESCLRLHTHQFNAQKLPKFLVKKWPRHVR